MSDMNHGVRAGYEDDAPKPLDDAVFDALIRGGDDLLKDAHRFVSLVCDFADLNLPAVVLLRRNCDNTYLAPFDRLATQSRGVTQDDFVGAMREACEYLVSTRNVTDTKCAKDATSQVAYGLYQYLQNSMRTSGLYKPNIWKIEPKIDSESDTGEIDPPLPPNPPLPDPDPPVPDPYPPYPPVPDPYPPVPPAPPTPKPNPLRKVAIVVGALLLFAALGIGSFFVATRVLRTTVSFNGNGADSGTVRSKSTLKGDTIELPDNDYVREGYAFAGWSPERKHGNLYDEGEIVTVNDNTTYYAIWRTGISFDGNGATSGETQTVYADEYGIIKAPECGFKRDGYEFTGWSTASKTREYQPGDDIPDTGSSMVLYAEWREASQISEPPGGGGGGVVFPYDIPEDGYILPDSNTRRYTEEEAWALDDKHLYFARNEIYARYGRGFLDPMLTEYFDSRTWYHKTMEWNQWNDLYGAEAGDNSICNDIEKHNWNLFYQIEKKRDSPWLKRQQLYL